MSRHDEYAVAFRNWLGQRQLKETLEVLTDADLPKRYAVQFALLIERKPFEERLTKHKRLGQVRRLTATADGGAVYEFTSLPTEDGERVRLPFRLNAVDGAPLLILLAVATASQWRDHLAKLVDALHPVVFRPFLRQAELREIFVSMQSSLRDEFKVRLTRVSSARRLLQAQSRRRYSSEVTWTDLDPGDAFQQASENLSYFKKVAFEVCEGTSMTDLRSMEIEGTVSRNAHFSVSGQAGWLFNACVRPAIERAKKDFEFSRNRGRLGQAKSKVTALVAEFDEGVSFERSDMPKIAAVLRAMPHTAVSILHGNPYLHASLVDMRDGSAFDLLLASDRRMMLVPQLRATEAAVTRVCSYIYDQIGEAEFVAANELS